jgi:hypothetical protein
MCDTVHAPFPGESRRTGASRGNVAATGARGGRPRASCTNPGMALTPHPRPESAILGNFYQCNPVSADLVVADSGNWLLHGIVTDGQKLAGMVGNEYAQVDLGVPPPIRWRCCSTPR